MDFRFFKCKIGPKIYTNWLFLHSKVHVYSSEMQFFSPSPVKPCIRHCDMPCLRSNRGKFASTSLIVYKEATIVLFEHYLVSVMRYHNMMFLHLSWMFIAAVVHVCSSAQLDLDRFGSSDTFHTVDNSVSNNL